MEIKVEGAEQLHVVYQKIREVGSKELRTALTRAIRVATTPTKTLIKERELATLPKKGGLAAATARNKITNKVRMSQRDPGVSINIIAEYDIKAMDRGRLRHPVFYKKGKKVWVNQKIEPGIVTGPIDETKPRVQEQIMTELREIARKLDN